MLFSVIIPTFNRAQRLKRALESLSQQTFKDFEVLVCDDGSTDDTELVVSAFKAVLNIRYFWSENWGGPARPRNIGISHSKGEWICFLDSDDWWRFDKLEICAKYTDKSDLIYHCLSIHNEELNKISNKKVGDEVEKEVLKGLLIKGNVIPNSSVVVRKVLLQRVGLVCEDKRFVSMEDYDLWLKIASITNGFKFISTPLGVYNWNSDTNISKISEERISKELLIFKKYRVKITGEDFKEARSVLRYKLGRYYHALNKRHLALKYLKSSFQSNNIKQKIKTLIFYIYFLVKN